MHTISHNWAEHVAFGAASVHLPASTAEVQDVVRAARKVRAVGARHSFNAIADTSGALVSLRGLDRRIEIDATARTVTVDGGMTYSELCPVLDAAGWALANLASHPDFTIVGAVATATHGSGNGNQNLAGAICIITFVTADGTLRTLRRGEMDFEGALVGAGSLGVVTALTLDLVPRFDMRQDIVLDLPFDAVTENFDALMGLAYNVSLFTHWRGDMVDQAWFKSVGSARPDGTQFGGHFATADVNPVSGKPALGTTAQMGVVGPWYDRLPHVRIGVLSPDGYEFQSEYFVARSDAPAAMRALKAVQDQLQSVLVVSEIRTIAADPFWLSPNYREDSVAFHFSFHRDWPEVQKALAAIEGALALFRPRPHWGKLFVMPATELMSRYPRLGDFRALAARHDPEGKFRNAFSESYLFGN
jgi:xylitol oxidase